jgi:CubicO group peptidase (beta-lactamase class C family)
MTATGFDHHRLQHLDRVLRGYADRGEVQGLTWLVARDGEVHVGWAGANDVESATPAARDSLYRIASMSKPVTAAACLTYVEDGTLRLDDPLDAWLPELADRQVLVDPAGPAADTVPAERPITLRDALTFRLGYGMDFGAMGRGERQTQLDLLAEHDLGGGPPHPQAFAPVDEWLKLLGGVPLAHQPGARWLYHVGADVAGALLERVGGAPLEAVVRERVLDPLGMADTSFSVPADRLARFGGCYGTDPASGERFAYDLRDGEWAVPPAFPSGGAGLVSTVDDYSTFAGMLLAGGVGPNGRVLSRASVELMTTNHLTAQQLADSAPSDDGSEGWGFGVAVQLRKTQLHGHVGTYGWSGGLGSTWSNDPAEGLVGVILTNEMFTSPALPLVHQDFWTLTAAAVA